MEWKRWLRTYGLQIGLIVAGIVVMGVGWWTRGAELGSTEGVTVVTTDEAGVTPGTVMVDVAGAVVRPGVYSLPAGSRVADALQAAGGMGGEADGEWVGRYVNQAEIVKDGAKIYVPVRETETVSVSAGKTAGTTTGNQAVKVNVNTASVQELEGLWGIGAARAAAIIQNRPYNSVAELTGKAGIPAAVVTKNQDILSIY